LPADSSVEREVPSVMTTSAMHMGGHTAGAARLGTCPALHLGYAGNHAPAHTRKWLVEIQAVSPVFATDRAIPRPLERSP
jgi:hypothetical protein